MAGASRPLRSAHLPLPQSVLKVKELSVEETFGFLKMPVELTNESVKDWEFLRLLKVGTEMNLDFYISILREHAKRNGDDTVLGVRSIVPDVYNAISEHCITAKDKKYLQQVNSATLIAAANFKQGSIPNRRPDFDTFELQGGVCVRDLDEYQQLCLEGPIRNKN